MNKYLTPLYSSCISFLTVAVSHNRHFLLWDEAAPASPGVQNFAELGVTVELMKAAKEARKRRTVGAMYRTAGIPNGIGHSSTDLLMQPRNSLVGTNKTLTEAKLIHKRTHMLRHSKSHKSSAPIKSFGDLGLPITLYVCYDRTLLHFFPLSSHTMFSLSSGELQPQTPTSILSGLHSVCCPNDLFELRMKYC